MLKIITHHRGNANQNYSEIISHLTEWLKSKPQEGNNVLVMMWRKKEPSCSVGGNWYNHCGKQYGSSSKN